MAQLDQEALSGAWRRYKDTGDIQVRNDLVLHYGSLVRYVAAKVASGLPSMVDRDDLVSYGQFGLLDAMESYDLDRGVKFETFAIARIRGSIIDELRKLDWVPRGVRSKARDIERAHAELLSQLGRLPDDSELAAHLGVTVQDLWHAQSQTAAAWISSSDEHDDDRDRQGVGEVSFDPTANPEDLFTTTEVSDLLAAAVSGMPERHKTILALYYVQEMTLAEIGQVLGVTESRVCQLQGRVLQSLRDALSSGALNAA